MEVKQEIMYSRPIFDPIPRNLPLTCLMFLGFRAFRRRSFASQPLYVSLVCGLGLAMDLDGMWCFRVCFFLLVWETHGINSGTSSTTTRDRNLQFRGRRLHWRLSTGFFACSPVFMCNLVRRAPLIWRKVAKNPGENRVKSCHVCGRHGFSGPG